MAARKRKRRSKHGWHKGVRRRADGDWDVRLKWTDEDGEHDTIRVAQAATEEEAILKRRDMLKELSAPAAEKMTFSEALAMTLPSIEKNATREAYRIQGAAIAKVFGDRRLSSIQPVEIQRFLHDGHPGDATSAQRRAAFSAVYRHVKRLGLFAGANPVRETEPRKTVRTAAERLAAYKNQPKRAYNEEQALRFLEALPSDLRALQALQLFLGCRFGEVSALEWEDVDLDAGTVAIGRNQHRGVVDLPKSGEARMTALGPHAGAMLRAHKERMAEMKWPGWERLVFPRPLHGGEERSHDYWIYETVRRAVIKAQRDIGAEVVSRTHAMRHTHITVAEKQLQHDVDATLADAQLHRQMTGHASEKQRAAYVDKRALPANRIAAKIEGAIVNRPTEPEK